jgi:hypothetical protein
MPSPLGEGQTDMPINHDHLGEVQTDMPINHLHLEEVHPTQDRFHLVRGEAKTVITYSAFYIELNTTKPHRI